MNKNFKELIHPFLIKFMSLKTTGKLKVIGQLPADTNCLIVANHLSIEDIPTLGQAVKKHFYLLVSDEDKNTIDGLGLMLNGVQWVHRTSKESRVNASKNIVKMLKKGKIFAMYPEATWNLSPNNLIMQMNYGCIRIALEAKVPIVPVVTFFGHDKRYTRIGEPFYPTNDLADSISILRDVMCTLYYEEIQDYYRDNYGKIDGIYCTIIDDKEYYFESRDNIDKNYWNNYVDGKYSVYKRANSDKSGVRAFESQFIFTPKDDKYDFFQEFNSVIKKANGRIIVRRISSEKNGYMQDSFGEFGEKDHFGYGYNEKVLKRKL